MRSLLFALIVGGLAFACAPYGHAIASVFGTQGHWTLLAAVIAAFLPPWWMGKAFMPRKDAAREAARRNSRPDYYDFDEHHWHHNPQDADPEGIKLQYLLLSLGAWGFQVFLVYKTVRYG